MAFQTSYRNRRDAVNAHCGAYRYERASEKGKKGTFLFFPAKNRNVPFFPPDRQNCFDATAKRTYIYR